jgi:hypothetical protein
MGIQPFKTSKMPTQIITPRKKALYNDPPKEEKKKGLLKNIHPPTTAGTSSFVLGDKGISLDGHTAL